MEWKTKDRLLKIGFIIAISVMIMGIIYSYGQCQRSSVERMFYGDPVETKQDK